MGKGRRSSNPRRFLGPAEVERVEAAIGAAEAGTSGQIKVILVRHCWLGLSRKAARLFRKFGLEQTALRNCVLIMLVTGDRRFLIHGDRGIHEHVGSEFWRNIRNTMQAHFREDDFAAGLCAGVKAVGKDLAEHFPPTGGPDELPNRIEYAA